MHNLVFTLTPILTYFCSPIRKLSPGRQHELRVRHHILKFYDKVLFIVMGKMLSGKLSCMRTGLVKNDCLHMLLIDCFHIEGHFAHRVYKQ